MLQKEDLLYICASAIKSGNLKELKAHLFEMETHQSWIGNRTLSPLHIAAYYGQVEICTFLLEQGITPDVTDPYTSKTPLHIAAYSGHLEVVKILKKFHATLDIQDSIFTTPMHYAAMKKNKDLILFFLENNIKASSQSLFGNILDILIRKKDFELVDFFSSIGGVDCIDSALFRYDIPRQRDQEEWTPFHSAAVSGQENIFEMLINKFPYLPSKTNEKLTCSLEDSSVSVYDLAILQGSQKIKQLLHIDISTEQYRNEFMKLNNYEEGFPDRKEVCSAIRHRDMKMLQSFVESKREAFLFEREKGKWSLEPPNALEFAEYLYCLPFFDFLLENKIEIPEREFFPRNSPLEFFINWALMEAHPKGEMFFKNIETEFLHV